MSALWRIPATGAEGVRRESGADLSGKRTEWSAERKAKLSTGRFARSDPDAGAGFFYACNGLSMAWEEVTGERSRRKDPGESRI